MATRLSEEYVIGSKSLVPMNSPSSHTYNQQMDNNLPAIE